MRGRNDSAEKKAHASALTLLRAYFEHKNGDLNNVNALEDQFGEMPAEYVVQKKISDDFN